MIYLRHVIGDIHQSEYEKITPQFLSVIKTQVLNLCNNENFVSLYSSITKDDISPM